MSYREIESSVTCEEHGHDTKWQYVPTGKMGCITCLKDKGKCEFCGVETMEFILYWNVDNLYNMVKRCESCTAIENKHQKLHESSKYHMGEECWCYWKFFLLPLSGRNYESYLLPREQSD